MKYHKLIMRIEAVSNDPRYTFTFDSANVGGDTMAEAIAAFFRAPPRRPMTIMQIVGFPAEVGPTCRTGPNGIRLWLVERLLIRCCSSARRRTATLRPIAVDSVQPAHPE